MDISDQKSKGFEDLKEKSFEYAITMGCKDICPFVSAMQRIDWNVSDPKGKPIEAFRETRDGIERKVREFVVNL